jgi:hypothetical protein
MVCLLVIPLEFGDEDGFQLFRYSRNSFFKHNSFQVLTPLEVSPLFFCTSPFGADPPSQPNIIQGLLGSACLMGLTSGLST